MAEIEADREARRPRVSVGLPVYDGETYLAKVLDSIAGQTFRDYELIISDNASTDRTQEICEARAAADPRIRYSRNAKNIGGDNNFYRCFQLSRGDYFLGIAHDDFLHPDYLARTVSVLDADDSVVLCHARTFTIDADGAILRIEDPHPFSDSPRAPVRFADAIAPRPVIAHLALLRARTVRELPPLLAYPSSDAYWQAELALRGRLVEIPEPLFYRRIRPDSGGAAPLRERMGWSDPSRAHAIVFPSWRRPAEYARSVFRCSLTPHERLQCFREIGRFLRRRGGARPLVLDIRTAARTFLDRFALGHRLLELRNGARKP